MENKEFRNCIEEDEIDLKELFSTIWKYKKFILSFVFIITLLTILWTLTKPNQYKVYTVLAPQEQSKTLGGLGALASMAGVNVGGAEVTPDIVFNNLLSDYPFMKQFIIKNKIDKKLLSPNFDKDFIFALNFRGLYDLLHSKNKEQTNQINFFQNIYMPISKMISISLDQKTGLITASVEGPNREFNYYLLTKFLEEATNYLVNKNLNDINLKIKKYQEELVKTNNLELKQELASLISNLIKQKVYINSSKYYKVKVITDPYIPDTKDKTKPKRGLIVIVAFITSFILAIFLVFFIEFIKSTKEEEK